MNKPEHKDRGSVIAHDLTSRNVFLKYNEDRRDYPDLKLGDFGESLYLPKGGSRACKLYEGQVYAPEMIEQFPMSAKWDVWLAGCLIYSLAHRGEFPESVDPEVYTDDTLTYEEKKAITHRRRVKNIPSHYSSQLNHMIYRMLTYDRDARPSAGKLWAELKKMKDERIRMLFRPLPRRIRLFETSRNFDPEVMDLIDKLWPEKPVEGESEDEVDELRYDSTDDTEDSNVNPLPRARKRPRKYRSSKY